MQPTFNRLSRRRFLKTSAAASALTISPLAIGQESATAQPTWHNVEEWGLEGKGYNDTAHYYDRLPARAQQQVRNAVWRLSQHTAGMVARFKTDSDEIHVRYRLTQEQLEMPHMPATGVSGVDLYAYDYSPQRDSSSPWRWAATTKPGNQSVETRLIHDIPPRHNGAMREYLLYLPLYNGVESLEIGVPDNALLTGVAPRNIKPMVFYGTSIMQGACASRPGMAIPSILSRHLNRPSINLGFSGNGTMEASVGKFLAELDPAVYVIDCLPNMNGKQVAERCQALVKLLREARPKTPILLVEDRVNAGAWLRNGAPQFHQKNHAALKTAYKQMVADGTPHLHYLAGANLLGADGEATTDGSHPNDLGMLRYAEAYKKVLQQKIL